jgi:hypothetical protein
MCCRGSGPGPDPDLILPKLPWQLIDSHQKIWTQSLPHLIPFANATACFENAVRRRAGYGFSKAKVGCKPCFEGQAAQVSTVRTEKLVFSLNYERLGNRANVAGTGTSLCRLIGEWKIGSRTSPN